jgi:hypothetical protein
MKSHLQSYPCPLQINSFWNLGFLLGITIILQIITGIFLGLHYTSDLNSAYSSLFFFIREIFYGWCLRYLHSSGASFVFLFLFLHLGRAISYGSYFYNPNTWFSGIILFFFLMATAFMGYVLPFGQMSFWGATVITNLLSSFPSLIEWVSGGHYVYNPTLKRFFLFHFQFPFLLCGFRILHLFYLHFLSSNNPLRNSINNKIPFFPFIFHKDFFGFILILCLYLLQTHFGISSFSHPDICPDNAVRFNVMPRRIPDFPDSFHSWNFLSSIGSGITFLSFAIFYELMYSNRGPKHSQLERLISCMPELCFLKVLKFKHGILVPLHLLLGKDEKLPRNKSSLRYLVILVEHPLVFLFTYSRGYSLEEPYLMVLIFIIQRLGFQELFFSSS